MTATELRAQPHERYLKGIRFAQVCAAKRERAQRTKHLPIELFAEPGWDILLELYAFQLIGRRVSETDLADQMTVPTTVAIRWMKMLEAQNLIKRCVDQGDYAAVMIELSRRGVEAMDQYFSEQYKPLHSRDKP